MKRKALNLTIRDTELERRLRTQSAKFATSRHSARKRIFGVLSGICFGVFVAPVAAMIWFVVPWLHDVPSGDSSAHGIGLPLGFCIGIALGLLLNRRFEWGMFGTQVGGFVMVVAFICGLGAYLFLDGDSGWESVLLFLAVVFFSAHVFLAGFGLLLSGFFARRFRRERSVEHQ